MDYSVDVAAKKLQHWFFTCAKQQHRTSADLKYTNWVLVLSISMKRVPAEHFPYPHEKTVPSDGQLKHLASRDALLWLCRSPSGCRSLMRSARCGSVRTGTCWVGAHWRRPGSRCSPGLRLGVDADASVDADEDGRLWTQRECCFGEGVQTGLMGRPGPWMDPGVPVCPGYPGRRKRFTF